MKLKPNKTFPHPVLRSNVDDYISRQFQAVRNFSLSEDDVPILEYNFTLSEESILDLLDKRKAKYAIEIYCPTTLLRRVAKTNEKTGYIKLKKGDLYRRVEVNAFVVCMESVKKYSSRNFNKEFGNLSVDLLPGDVLATTDTEIYYWDTEVVAPLRSVFDLVENNATKVGTFNIDTSGDKVKIQMHQNDKSRFEHMRNSEEQKPIAMFVYFSAVAEVLRQMKDAEPDGEDKRWYRTIEYKLGEMGKNLSESSDNIFILAQELLGKPFSRILPKLDSDS